MTAEYRPRLRPSRKNKITRKDNLLIVACENAEEAGCVEAAIVFALKGYATPKDAEPPEGPEECPHGIPLRYALNCADCVSGSK